MDESEGKSSMRCHLMLRANRGGEKNQCERSRPTGVGVRGKAMAAIHHRDRRTFPVGFGQGMGVGVASNGGGGGTNDPCPVT